KPIRRQIEGPIRKRVERPVRKGEPQLNAAIAATLPSIEKAKSA
ncbi:conserved hypothetical protein, partial [Trichinella spiralis]